jgi:Ca-activated chloride channel family protein
MPEILLTVRSDRALVRAEARSVRHALVHVTAPRATDRAGRIPANLAIVLDRSGSMAGEKFVLARAAVEQALAQLHPEDRFCLVVYDDRVDVLTSSTPASDDARRAALARLAAIEPRGSTDLAGGWMRGCEQVALAMVERPPNGSGAPDGAVSRCLLLTDGLANHGITDRDELIRHAAALRERGVQTSTFGVGDDFDERLLAGMADAGGGHFYFLSSARQIPELIASEVGEALQVVIPHASLELRLPTGVRAESLGRFRTSLTGGGALRIELGDLVAGQQIDVIVALHFPRGAVGESLGTSVALFDASAREHQAAPLQWTFATHRANDAQPRDRAVDRAVARLYAARARAEALEHNRSGDYDRAGKVLTATARRIRAYAGTDPELLALADQLTHELTVFAAQPMQVSEMKREYFAAYAASASRAPDGKALGR